MVHYDYSVEIVWTAWVMIVIELSLFIITYLWRLILLNHFMDNIGYNLCDSNVLLKMTLTLIKNLVSVVNMK